MSKEACCTCGQSILDCCPEKTKELKALLAAQPVGADVAENRSLLIEMLHKAQGLFGYLPEEVQTLVADGLRLNQADVYGVISFYSFFTTEPPGKFKINVCTGTACFVKGAGDVLREFEGQLDMQAEETRADGLYSLGSLRCVGACSLAPVVMVNERVYGKVTPDMVASIIKDCEGDTSAGEHSK